MERVVGVGMGQILVEDGDLEGNIDRIDKAVREARRQGCDIVVLPECCDVGWTSDSARDLARPVPGETSDAISAIARENEIHVATGLTERAGNRIYNCAILVDPAGQIVLKYRKINILEIAQDLYATGDRLGVAELSIGNGTVKTGLLICADLFPDVVVLGHSLARMDAQLILSPSAWAVDANHDNSAEPYGGTWMESYTSLAETFDIGVVGVSNVGWMDSGPWKGRKCIGNSIAVGPGGELLAKCPYGVNARCVTRVDVEIVDKGITGTNYSSLLRFRVAK